MAFTRFFYFVGLALFTHYTVYFGMGEMALYPKILQLLFLFDMLVGGWENWNGGMGIEMGTKRFEGSCMGNLGGNQERKGKGMGWKRCISGWMDQMDIL